MNNSVEIKIPMGVAPTVLGVGGSNISEISQVDDLYVFY